MTLRHGLSFRVLCGCFILLPVLGVAPPQAVQPSPPTDIPLKDMGSKFRVTGRFGKPLGEVVTLYGVIVRGKDKIDSGRNLQIQSVDGRPFDGDVRVPVTGIGGTVDENSLEYGKTYELIGFETGKFEGVPEEVFRRIEVAFATCSFQFHTYFGAIAAKETVSPQPGKP